MIYISDLHLRPESADAVLQVFTVARDAALQHRDRSIGILGDVFHMRYVVPVHLLNLVRDVFMDWEKVGIHHVLILPGNHDEVDVNGRNVLEVFSDMPNVDVFTEPTHHRFTGTWLPYRKDPQILLGWLKDNPPPPDIPNVAHLHHGIRGAWMNSGIQAGPLDGIKAEDLGMFARVYCGHWHRHQEISQCVYVGSQWQTRSDEAGQQKGLLISKRAMQNWWTGPEYQFVPLDIGKKFHKMESFSKSELAKIAPGDSVKVPAGTSQKMLSALTALGADVYAETEQKAYAGPRLGAAASTLREQAEKYVSLQTLPDELDSAALMRVYDELVSG